MLIRLLSLFLLLFAATACSLDAPPPGPLAPVDDAQCTLSGLCSDCASPPGGVPASGRDEIPLFASGASRADCPGDHHNDRACPLVHGVGQSADWLGCWGSKGVRKPVWGTPCGLNSALVSQIQENCRVKGSHDAIIVCVVGNLRYLMRSEKSNVCRHFAACVDKVLDGLQGLDSDVETRFLGPHGHAWVETDTPGWRFYTDAYNDVVYKCPL